MKRHVCTYVYARYPRSLEKLTRNSAVASLRSPSSRKKTKKFLNDPDVSLNEGFLKVYSALRNVTRSLFLSLSPFFSQLSLIFNVCPSFAPSARSTLLVRLARSIQFTSSFFSPRRSGIRTEQRKETYVLFREERTTASRRTSGEKEEGG